MLVLSRRIGESVIIGDGIAVAVVALGNGKVKLGFTAPHGVPIDRKEVADRKDGERRSGLPSRRGKR